MNPNTTKIVYFLSECGDLMEDEMRIASAANVAKLAMPHIKGAIVPNLTSTAPFGISFASSTTFPKRSRIKMTGVNIYNILTIKRVILPVCLAN
jgi:hypothetical protein